MKYLLLFFVIQSFVTNYDTILDNKEIESIDSEEIEQEQAEN